ncbi:MAG: class I SAM-dependent methyltransferase [Ignavibacteria bacterium]|nr:class I SAM-dependent methyltransferase [Ignavibacteria bacterium]
MLGDYARYYPSDYYSFAAADNEGTKNLTAIQKLKKSIVRSRDRSALTNRGVFGKALGTLFPDIEKKLNSLRVIQLKDDARILDVGCGSGEFVRYLNELGMKNVTGIDSYLQGDLDFGNGISVIKSDIHEIAGKGMKFDLIMMHHVIEHMHDPLEVLNSSFKMLTDNGSLLIRTPNAESYAWERFGANWVQIDAPRHIHVFTEKSLVRLAEKAGFAVSNIEFDSTEFQFWGSIQYENGICLNADNSFMTDATNSIFSESEIEGFREQSKKLNESRKGDQFAIHFRKAGIVETVFRNSGSS